LHNKKWKVTDDDVRILMEDELLTTSEFSPFAIQYLIEVKSVKLNVICENI